MRLPKRGGLLTDDLSVRVRYGIDRLISTPVTIYRCVRWILRLDSGIDVYAEAGLLIWIAGKFCVKEAQHRVRCILIAISSGKLARDVRGHVLRNMLIVFGLIKASKVRFDEHILVTRIRSPGGQSNVNTRTKNLVRVLPSRPRFHHHPYRAGRHIGTIAAEAIE